MTLFPPLPDHIKTELSELPALIDRVFPLPQKYRRSLIFDVSELSSLLTGDRGGRTASYLGKPALLSAYLRYFLPWNVFRLCRLLPHLPLDFKTGDAVTDIGAGPLTFALALWLSRPDLRAAPLEIRCVDRTQTALDAGKKLFAALAPQSAWTIKTIKGDIHTPLYGEKAALAVAVNVFNELYERIPHAVPLTNEAEKATRLLASLSDRVLVVEPGIPRSGEFISDIRAPLADEGFFPCSPCTHVEACPLSGVRQTGAHRGERRTGKGAASKWCHFAFDTLDAPPALLKLSADANLPKDRAVLSFLLAARTPLPAAAKNARVLSDSFPLPTDDPLRDAPRGTAPLFGRYACSVQGMILIRGAKRVVSALPSGSLVPAPPVSSQHESRDKKTGFPIWDV